MNKFINIVFSLFFILLFIFIIYCIKIGDDSIKNRIKKYNSFSNITVDDKTYDHIKCLNVNGDDIRFDQNGTVVIIHGYNTIKINPVVEQ